MKLKYKLTTYDQLDGGARFVQKLTGEPFHVMRYRGTVLINREIPHLDKVLQALEQWWTSEGSPETWDRSFESISKAATRHGERQRLTGARRKRQQLPPSGSTRYLRLWIWMNGTSCATGAMMKVCWRRLQTSSSSGRKPRASSRVKAG